MPEGLNATEAKEHAASMAASIASRKVTLPYP